MQGGDKCVDLESETRVLWCSEVLGDLQYNVGIKSLDYGKMKILPILVAPKVIWT